MQVQQFARVFAPQCYEFVQEIVALLGPTSQERVQNDAFFHLLVLFVG
jgi:hypothetical protein